MPQGLQVWDENGELVTDFTDRIGKVFASGQVTFTASSQSYTISVSGLVDDGSWYINCTGRVATRINVGSFTISRYSSRFTETGYWTVIKQ